MGVKKPITIRGVEYNSRVDACKALNIEPATLRLAVNQGRVDRVGLRINPKARKETTIRGVTYASRAAAGVALGLSRSTISNAIKRGSLQNVGYNGRATNKDQA